jgi:tetratricopeptide (TPR) repeat protein
MAALQMLKQSIEMIDAAQDPSLAYTARHNRITLLIDLDRFREAEKQLFLLRPLKHHGGGRINDLRFRWEEGRIDAGLGRFARAETALQEVREAFSEINRTFDSALASLELTAVLIAQGKAIEARKVALETTRSFVALGVNWRRWRP